MANESILGLLLRAHAKCAEQKHGEEYVHKNLSSAAHFEQAVSFIESAIQSISFAEQYVAREDAKKGK